MNLSYIVYYLGFILLSALHSNRPLTTTTATTAPTRSLQHALRLGPRRRGLGDPPPLLHRHLLLAPARPLRPLGRVPPLLHLPPLHALPLRAHRDRGRLHLRLRLGPDRLPAAPELCRGGQVVVSVEGGEGGWGFDLGWVGFGGCSAVGLIYVNLFTLSPSTHISSIHNN